MNFNQKGMDALLNMASKKMGTSADDLKNTIQSGNIEKLTQKIINSHQTNSSQNNNSQHNTYQHKNNHQPAKNGFSNTKNTHKTANDSCEKCAC